MPLRELDDVRGLPTSHGAGVDPGGTSGGRAPGGAAPYGSADPRDEVSPVRIPPGPGFRRIAMGDETRERYGHLVLRFLFERARTARRDLRTNPAAAPFAEAVTLIRSLRLSTDLS